MDMQKEREAFEAWISEVCPHVKMDLNAKTECEYDSSSMSLAWYAWQAAKASAVPDGFVLVDKSKINTFWQDDDEPENFCDRESDFDCLGDYIDLGDIMTINKHDQALVSTETLYGTWFADAIDPSAKANFFVGTHAECLAIVKKNKAMIEAAQEQS